MTTKATLWGLLLTAACSGTQTTVRVEDTALSLVGRWEPVARTMGGITTVLDFRDDGTCSKSLCVVVDGTYALDASDLRITMKEPLPAQHVEISAHTMVVDGTTTKHRVGTVIPGAGRIVGVWKSDLSNGTSYERYEASGHMQFRIPFPGWTGRYRLDGERLELTLDSDESVSTVRRRGDILVLETHGADARTREYALTSRWYPLTGDR